MAQPIISAENIGKRYRLLHQAKQPYSTLRDTLTAQAKRLFGGSSAADASHADSEEEFWALKDVNFEIQRGDVVGIIGRNGAGKSTLLKVLSRIVEPTTGRITLRGRVASLLEVGTGFHPELTGRDNIFLNGAILGMSKREIRSKFGEIVAFAEVEKFLDTPVKHYSSGMYVRLAFGVAAHLEPEVLIVDEVLAVGDAEFQKKCLGKMRDVASGGRTILFVSHNITAMSKLCTRGILLKHGRIIDDDSIEVVAQQYIDSTLQPKEGESFSLRHKHPDLRLVSVTVDKQGADFGDSLTVSTEWEAVGNIQVGIECAIRDESGAGVCYYGSGTLAGREVCFQAGRNVVSLHFPRLPLAQGRYTVDIMAAKTFQFFYVFAEAAVSFTILRADPLGAGYWFCQGRNGGAVFLPCEMETERETSVVGLGRAAESAREQVP
jgi:lipopolysaccharide transport system ATP-binding protein